MSPLSFRRLAVLALALLLTGCFESEAAPSDPSADAAGAAAEDPWAAHDAHNSNLAPISDWDGSIDGPRTLWHENGVKSGEGEFAANVKVGPWTYWHENGVERWQGTYVDGEPSGEERAWHDNGELHYEGTFQGGKKQGLYKEWNRRGELDREASGLYRDGRKVAELEGGK